jgi:hypothetical protein
VAPTGAPIEIDEFALYRIRDGEFVQFPMSHDVALKSSWDAVSLRALSPATAEAPDTHRRGLPIGGSAGPVHNRLGVPT